jgi:hypothetical protein
MSRELEMCNFEGYYTVGTMVAVPSGVLIQRRSKSSATTCCAVLVSGTTARDFSRLLMYDEEICEI